MVIDNNRVNIFLVFKFVINNQKELLALYVISNILPYSAQQSVSFLNPATLVKKRKDHRHTSYGSLWCLHKDNQFVVYPNLHLNLNS